MSSGKSSATKPADNPAQEAAKGKPPAHVERLAGVEAGIWENADSDGRPRFTVRIQKRFRDKDGAWRSSDYFFVDELPYLQEVSRKAFVWCAEERQRQAAAARSPE
jgi:hypothetical protein